MAAPAGPPQPVLDIWIASARNDLTEHLADSPSLQATLPKAAASAYRRARLHAEQQTGLPARTFPAECLWAFDQAITEELPGSTRDEP